MDDYSNKSVCVYDNGLFVSLAQRLSESFGRVYYTTPWEASAFPRSNARLIGQGIELFDQYAILLDRGSHHEDVHTARKRSAHHFPPLRLVAGLAGFAVAVAGEIVLAIAFFENALDFLRSDDRPIM